MQQNKAINNVKLSVQTRELGKRIIDIGQIVDVFEAQEGELQQIIGKTGNGKTYEGTRRALNYLKQGYTVYTTWQLILPKFYDEREDKQAVFWKTVTRKKQFYKFDFSKNWHYLDINRPDLIKFVSGLTDCIVFLDEGQDIFDSRERISKDMRKTITRTRHMHKTLIIISQRAQAVDVTARANVTFFYKCVKTRAWFWPFIPYFKVFRTEEEDNQNYPIWEDLITGWQAELWHKGFLSKKVYSCYNSWYLRAGIPKSQEITFEVYTLTIYEKLKALFRKSKKEEISQESIEGAKRINENIVKDIQSIEIEETKKVKRKSVDKSLPIKTIGV